MAHKHSVYDTDKHFAIDPITRDIRNEAKNKVKLMQLDHNSERFTFDIPRKVEDHDMSLCDRVEIHFINTGSSGSHHDKYIVDDVQVSPDDKDVVIFSWLISQNATRYAGKLDFMIRFICNDENGEAEYIWNTAIHSGISIANGMDNGEVIVEQYHDVLERWKQDVLSDIKTSEIYDGDGDIPEGYKLQLIGNKEHTGSFVDLNGIIGSPVVGSVGENNTITLSGNLSSGTYSIRFMLADGSAVEIGTVEVI